MLVKQVTFLYKAWPDLTVKRDIFNTEFWIWRKIGLVKDFDIGVLFIGELLVTSECRTLHFLDSNIYMDGRKKEKRIGKLKIN